MGRIVLSDAEDPLQGYLNNKDQVTHMHFKDLSAGTLGNVKSGPCVPGTGLIDLPAIIKAMKENGYRRIHQSGEGWTGRF